MGFRLQRGAVWEFGLKGCTGSGCKFSGGDGGVQELCQGLFGFEVSACQGREISQCINCKRSGGFPKIGYLFGLGVPLSWDTTGYPVQGFRVLMWVVCVSGLSVITGPLHVYSLPSHNALTTK